MIDKEIRAKYDLTKFKVVDEFEYEVQAPRAVYNLEKVKSIHNDLNCTAYWEALVDLIDFHVTSSDTYYYDYYDICLVGKVVKKLEDDTGEVLWHVKDTLYKPNSDSDIDFDMYFDHKPDKYEVIDEIHLAEEMTDDYDETVI